MGNNKSKRTTIAVSKQTKDTLDVIKNPGQSLDGIIIQLIDLWEERKEFERKELAKVQ